ncbi:hypothetical protein D1007_53257 [Hordeum vulgare]|nr:hypothetical protein D1007_53257 [Hordeum vulgare]
MELDMHHVDTHFRKKDLTVVYTGDRDMVEDSINTLERLLAQDDKYKVVGFDLAFTDGHAGHDQKVTVTQLYAINNRKVLKTLGLVCQMLVDIHNHYKIWGSKKDKDSHVYLVVAIINPYYRDMKVECEKNKLV